MGLSFEDAQFILRQLTLPEVCEKSLLELHPYFRRLIREKNLEESLFSVCELIARVLYLNYADFLPKISHQISALYFLLSVYERANNPFIGFLFDIINIDAYRTLNPVNKSYSSKNSLQAVPIENDSEEYDETRLQNLGQLYKDLLDELDSYEFRLQRNQITKPLSISLFTVEDFPNLPIICKQVLYCLTSGCVTKEILTLTPELLSVRTGKLNTRSKFDGKFILESIQKQETNDDWKTFKLPFCPIYVNEHFFSDRKMEQKELLRMILEDINDKSYQVVPDYIRPLPPITPIQEHEFVFPYPSILKRLDLEWNHEICENNDDKKDIKELRNTLKKSISTHLYPNQTQNILNRLRSCDKIIFDIDLTPEKFMEMVENNPAIATEIIVIFVKYCSSNDETEADRPTITFEQIGQYLMKIMDVDISVQSMEVINGLSSRIVLPVEFMHSFISHSIKSCDNIKDKTLQSRLARLNCVFLQSLITNKLINVADIRQELQLFCVEFFNLREATSLYKMLQSDIQSNIDDKSDNSE